MVRSMSSDIQTENATLAELEALRREVAALRQRVAEFTCPDADEVSYRELVQSANTIVLRWDLQGRVTFLNDFGLEFFGFRDDELVGRSVVGTIVPETETSGRDLAQMIAELLQHPDRYVNNENENMCRNGRRVWITWRNRTLHDAAAACASCSRSASIPPNASTPRRRCATANSAIVSCFSRRRSRWWSATSRH